MVFKFLTWLKNNVTEEQFKDILSMADQDIKFNRAGFGKTTKPIEYVRICTRCAGVVLRIGGAV